MPAKLTIGILLIGCMKEFVSETPVNNNQELSTQIELLQQQILINDTASQKHRMKQNIHAICDPCWTKGVLGAETKGVDVTQKRARRY